MWHDCGNVAILWRAWSVRMQKAAENRGLS